MGFLISQIIDGPGFEKIIGIMDTAVKDSVFENHPFGIFPRARGVFRQSLKDPRGEVYPLGEKARQGIFQKGVILEDVRDLMVDELPEIGDIPVKRDDHTILFEGGKPADVGREDGRDELSL